MNGWRAGPALYRAVLVLAALVSVGLVTGRATLLVLAAPLLVGTLAALAEGSAGRGAQPRVTATAPRVAAQGQRVDVRVQVEHADGAQLAVLRVPDGVRFPHGRFVATAVIDGRAVADASAALRQWGVATVARPDVLVVGPDALVLHGPSRALDRTVAVLPAAEKVPAVALPPRAAGLVGTHRTRRPGDGSDLLDVREFLPGDRMRRIDWRVSARRGVLHVRRTAVDADAEVVLCVDTRYDVGADVAQWPHPPGLGAQGASRFGSSLDVAVRATASLAQSILHAGDRVSVLDLSRPQLSVPPGSGLRQLRRVRRQLAEVAVHLQARRLVLRPGVVPARAVVVLFSPLLDAAVADLAVSLLRRGGEVIVVDVLPEPLRPPRRSRAEQLAHRLLQAERDQRIADLRRRGVAVIRWDPVALPMLLRRRARDRRRVV